MIIKLVRHGLSEANTREVDVTRTGDHSVKLTEIGKRQAILAGKRLLHDSFLEQNIRQETGKQEVGTLIYVSPYIRTRETLACILSVAPTWIKVYEDPRLREIEWGYDQPENYGKFIDSMEEIHGKFYFRREGGESPADGYDRVSGFIATMMRQVERKSATKILIVTHGLTIRCFVMRFMHLSVEEFDIIKNPKHCDIITIADTWTAQIIPQFTTGRWQVGGLRLPDCDTTSWPQFCPSCSKREVWPDELSTDEQHAQPVARCESCKYFRVMI